MLAVKVVVEVAVFGVSAYGLVVVDSLYVVVGSSGGL